MIAPLKSTSRVWVSMVSPTAGPENRRWSCPVPQIDVSAPGQVQSRVFFALLLRYVLPQLILVSSCIILYHLVSSCIIVMACHHEEHMHDHVCCQSKMLKQRKPKVLRGPRRQPRQPRWRCSNQTMFGPLGIASAEKATQIGGFLRISAFSGNQRPWQPDPALAWQAEVPGKTREEELLCCTWLRFAVGDS